jgi:predicted alpha/beta superfamily hydrolase
MSNRRGSVAIVLSLAACAPSAAGTEVCVPTEPAPVHAPADEPLTIGETFTIDSHVLGETRRINVFVPTIYGEAIDAPLPVLYMPDGGMSEDFLHVAGLLQVSVSSGVMRPFMLVGIENTQRRRDMTGPTTNAKDMEIAPEVGGSAAFRRFIADELVPAVKQRYRTTDETAIVGESLAGLFVIETFFLQPDLFDSYIALDPSLWWADQELLRSAAARLAAHPPRDKAVFLASSSEPELADLASRLATVLSAHRDEASSFTYEPFPEESHATIYHPSVLRAFRVLFAPLPAAAAGPSA